jgi:hypothetical protein
MQHVADWAMTEFGQSDPGFDSGVKETLSPVREGKVISNKNLRYRKIYIFPKG